MLEFTSESNPSLLRTNTDLEEVLALVSSILEWPGRIQCFSPESGLCTLGGDEQQDFSTDMDLNCQREERAPKELFGH